MRKSVHAGRLKQFLVCLVVQYFAPQSKSVIVILVLLLEFPEVRTYLSAEATPLSDTHVRQFAWNNSRFQAPPCRLQTSFPGQRWPNLGKIWAMSAERGQDCRPILALIRPCVRDLNRVWPKSSKHVAKFG